MSFVINVLYPSVEGSVFDFDYYRTTHTPLVQEVFQTRAINVSRGVGALGGGAPSYVLMAELVFDTREALDAALAAPRAGEVFADIAKFTDVAPVAQIGERTS